MHNVQRSTGSRTSLNRGRGGGGAGLVGGGGWGYPQTLCEASLYVPFLFSFYARSHGCLPCKLEANLFFKTLTKNDFWVFQMHNTCWREEIETFSSFSEKYFIKTNMGRIVKLKEGYNSLAVLCRPIVVFYSGVAKVSLGWGGEVPPNTT